MAGIKGSRGITKGQRGRRLGEEEGGGGGLEGEERGTGGFQLGFREEVGAAWARS